MTFKPGDFVGFSANPIMNKTSGPLEKFLAHEIDGLVISYPFEKFTDLPESKTYVKVLLGDKVWAFPETWLKLKTHES